MTFTPSRKATRFSGFLGSALAARRCALRSADGWRRAPPIPARRSRPLWQSTAAARLGSMRQRARLHAAQAHERADHRLGRAEQPRRARVGAEFALPREPHDDYQSKIAEHDLADEHRDVVTRPDAALGAEHGLVHDEAHDARKEKHEGIEHAL